MVSEFQRRSTGASLGAVNHDEVGRDAGLQHGLHHGKPFPGVADTQLEACGLATRELPQANRLMLHVMSAMGEYEGQAIAQRTRDAMAAAKARGQVFGNPHGAAALRRAGKGNTAAVARLKATADNNAQALADMVADIRAGGVSTLSGIAHELERRGARTARGGRWSATQVGRLLARLG